MKSTKLFFVLGIVVSLIAGGCGGGGGSETGNTDNGSGDNSGDSAGTATVSSLSEIPEIDEMVTGSGSSASALKRAVSGTPPNLTDIDSNNADTTFWNGLIAEINNGATITETMVNNFWGARGHAVWPRMSVTPSRTSSKQAPPSVT